MKQSPGERARGSLPEIYAMLPIKVVETYFRKHKIKFENRDSHAFDAELVPEPWTKDRHEFQTIVRIEDGGKYIFIYSRGLAPVQKSNPQFAAFIAALNRFNNDTRCAKAAWDPDTLEPVITIEMHSLSGKLSEEDFHLIFGEYVQSIGAALERIDAALKPKGKSASRGSKKPRSTKSKKLRAAEGQVCVGQYVERNDDDEEFSGIFKITWVSDPPGDQHADTEVMLKHIENENECSDSVDMVVGNLVDDRRLARMGLKQPKCPDW
jgi:hypothetical protein